jgi:hypothetical protein
VSAVKERGLHQCDFCWRDDLEDMSYRHGHIDGGPAQIIQVCSHCRRDALINQRITDLSRRERRAYRKAMAL